MNRHLRKYAKPLSCLAAGAVLLSGAVFANYENANGYTNYKNAVKGMLDQTNFSVDGEIRAEIDGEMLISLDGTFKQSENGSSTFSTARAIGEDENISKDTVQDGWGVSIGKYGNNHTNWYFSKKENPTGHFIAEEDRNLVDKIVNFVDVLADTMVGDLKNNFVMVDSKDGNKSYQVSLAGSQVPELVRSGMSVLFATVKNEGHGTYYDEIEYNSVDGLLWTKMLAGEQDPFIKEATCYLTLDSEGRLIKNDLKGTMTSYDKNGGTHDLTVTIALNLYDYGTTSPERIDLSEIPAINAVDENGNALTLDDLLSCGKQVSYHDDKNNVYGTVQPIDYSAPNVGADARKNVGRMYISNGTVVSEEAFHNRGNEDADTVEVNVESVSTDDVKEASIEYEDDGSDVKIGGADASTTIVVEKTEETEKTETPAEDNSDAA